MGGRSPGSKPSREHETGRFGYESNGAHAAPKSVYGLPEVARLLANMILLRACETSDVGSTRRLAPCVTAPRAHVLPASAPYPP